MTTFDFKKIRKEYNKLGIPAGLFNPADAPLESHKYFVIDTERASGKTTNVLLMGLVCHKLYGTVIQYIRQRDDMLTPKNAKNLCDVIISAGYISKLTNDKYNTMIYKARRWYYAKIVGDEIADTALEPCIVCLSLQSDEIYKSSYNAPNGDWIIFDEFCTRRHLPDEFILFCDLLSTIIRTRSNPLVWLLGNILDRYDYYFDELEIADYMKYLEIGESMSVKTSKGTPIFIEIFSPNRKEKKEKINKLFFGFKNSKINAITGEDWVIVPYQHIDKMDDTREVLDASHFLIYEKEILQVEICNSEKYGVHAIVHRSTNSDHSNAVIYTCENALDMRYRYRFGHSNVDRMLWTLYDRNKFFYATNSAAALTSKYVQLAKQTKP